MDRETAKRLAIAAQFLTEASDRRIGSGLDGRVCVEVFWNNGKATRVRLVDETTVDKVTLENPKKGDPTS